MSKILRDLLDAEEPLFSMALSDLERASGERGIDIKLIGDMAAAMQKSVRKLGLDPRDSAGAEIYSALMNRVRDDNERVTKIIGGTDSSDVAHMVPLMVATAKKSPLMQNVWVLKHSVAKKMLKQMPPEKLMAHLGYRSIDSMLRHEDIDETYVAIRFSEGAEWLERYDEMFKSVTPSDFETRDIEIVIMNHEKYVDLAAKFVAKKLHNITHVKELGVIAVVPMVAKKSKGLTLKTLPLLYHYLNEIRLYSTFFKLKQVEKNFGEIVVNTLIADPSSAAQIAGRNVHWRVIQRYFGKLKTEEHPEAFQPHVQPEDLHWRRAEDSLYELDPEMKFWQDLDWVGQMYDDAPLTLNFMDVSLSYANDVPYSQHYFYHFRESLWNEIFIRYLGMQNLEDQVLRKLDNDMIAPESL